MAFVALLSHGILNRNFWHRSLMVSCIDIKDNICGITHSWCLAFTASLTMWSIAIKWHSLMSCNEAFTHRFHCWHHSLTTNITTEITFVNIFSAWYHMSLQKNYFFFITHSCHIMSHRWHLLTSLNHVMFNTNMTFVCLTHVMNKNKDNICWHHSLMSWISTKITNSCWHHSLMSWISTKIPFVDITQSWYHYGNINGCQQSFTLQEKPQHLRNPTSEHVQ